MEDKSELHLILKGKKIVISSNFRNFYDVNPIISESLATTKKYEIQSDVKEEVLMSFIKHWTTSETPNINPYNFTEFLLLSDEFDRMKDLIQMYKLQTEKHQLSLLNFTNQMYKKKIEKKRLKINKENLNYEDIIKSLITKNGLGIHQDNNEIKQKLCSACFKNDNKSVSLLVRRQVTDNKIVYLLNEEDKTADLFYTNYEKEKHELFIPRSVNYNSQEYLITKILPGSIRYEYITSFRCADDSELKIFDDYYIHDINSITIPSCFDLLHSKKFNLSDDSKITIIPSKSQNIKFDNDNKFILSKSNSESKDFDALCYVDPKLKSVTIPSFIKKIGEHAFKSAKHLEDVTFLKDSQLRSINEYSFGFISIKKIIIPSFITCIEKNAFYGSKIEIIQFLPDSQLHTIESEAFDYSLKILSIPSSVSNLEDGWCKSTSDLTKIQIIPNQTKNILLYGNQMILAKSDPTRSNIFDDLKFACRDIKETIIIPSFIKRISPYSFAHCGNLKEVKFLSDSQLHLIDKFAFFDSSINRITIPQQVYQIKNSAFSCCNNLKIIDFAPNSQLVKFGSEVLDDKIEHIYIPSKVSNINKYWLLRTDNLINISVDPQNKNFITYENKLILGKSRIDIDVFDMILFADRNIEKITIPPFIKIIGNGSFKNCKNLRYVNFNNNDTKLQIIGENAFEGTSIMSISIPDNVIQIGESSFSDCSNLKKVKISRNSKLREINKSAFSQSSISGIFIPSNVNKIGKEAFENDNLKIIEIGDNINYFTTIKNICSNFHEPTTLITMSNDIKRKRINLNDLYKAYLDRQKFEHFAVMRNLRNLNF